MENDPNEIFVNTDEPLVIGAIHIGEIFCSDGDRLLPVKCIRAATKEEYLEFVKARKLEHMVNRGIDDKLFYLVQVMD